MCCDLRSQAAHGRRRLQHGIGTNPCREREERACAKAAAEADAAWRKVLRAALTRVRLDRDHRSSRGLGLAAGAPPAGAGRSPWLFSGCHLEAHMKTLIEFALP
jgi:hypothetical protein